MTDDPETGPGQRVRIAVLLDHPAQYISPALRALAMQDGVQPRVYYWRAPNGPVFDPGFTRVVQWHTDLYSGYEWWAPEPELNPVRRRIALLSELRRFRPQAFLCFGWASPVTQTGLVFAALTGAPLLYICDTNGRAAEQVDWRRRLRRLGRRVMLRAAWGAVYTGVANRSFYIAAGFPPERLHPGVLPVDVDLFIAAAQRRRTSTRRTVVGYVGKLQDFKCVDDLIAACALLRDDARWELWLVGDGPARSSLESMVESLGLAERVRFFGFRNTDEVPDLMAAMDVLVLPSRMEARGLVAIEAMATGATAVVSDATGVWGNGDVVEHGVTGLVYPVRDVVSLAGHLRRLLDDPAWRDRLASAGRQRASRFGPRDFATASAAALLRAANRDTSLVG